LKKYTTLQDILRLKFCPSKSDLQITPLCESEIRIRNKSGVATIETLILNSFFNSPFDHKQKQLRCSPRICYLQDFSRNNRKVPLEWSLVVSHSQM
jgi:hypothetical protein